MITPATASAARRHGESAESQGWLPIAGGAALVALALARKGSLLKLAALVGGGFLLFRALESGALRLPPGLIDALREQAGLPREGQTATEPFDRVDEASMESFPGSDPPGTY